MVDYKNLYLQLAAMLADSVEILDSLSAALKRVQQQNEADIMEE